MAKMERTRHRGIYKRGSRYVVRYRAGGKNRAESARTLDEAIRIKRQREAARDRGEFDLTQQARRPFKDYALEWIESYQGNGRNGFREDTRADYRRDLERHAIPFFSDRLNRTLAGISPRDVQAFISHLCDEGAQGRALADATIRRILAPLRSCLSSARREGAIRANPVDSAVLPNRPQIEDDQDEHRNRAMTRAELEMLLRVVHPDWRLFFEFLAATGLRWSEAIALRWGDVELDGSNPVVRVRRAFSEKGREFKPPKSRYGKRSIPLDSALVCALRARRNVARFADDADLVFPATNGKPLRSQNVRRRVLEPAAQEAGVAWVGFHSFRHTCASILFDQGRNAKQVQRWLGHHAASFTLDTYAHLLDDGVGEGLNLRAELAGSENRTRTSQDETHLNEPKRDWQESPKSSGELRQIATA